jgi:hypothetical protein
MTRIRAGAWLILLALAGAQAWFARFYATPDGVSYMDLSDAVLAGQWGELLNAYWSPLYPALIGALRAILRPTAYWEFGVPHLLNFLLFAASLAAFEYFVAALRRLGRERWGKPGLDTPWGTAGAYALFGAFTLMMTPLVLPTPDLLVSAASFVVFGALLRLRYDIAPRTSGIVLGLALAAGSLAKSFIVPWAAICIVTALVSLRGRSMKPAIVAAGIWILAVVPWTIGLSSKYGHLTFGDTGRLTYVWYVNRVETPSDKLMPRAAATPATDSVLRGIAMTPNAPGSHPVWYDPARWYGNLRPTFSLPRQTSVFGILLAEYIASLAPVFLVIAFWLIAAGRDALVDWWKWTWPIVVPALAALMAYSLVLVTTRYVAPFYMALVLAVIGGVRWPERIPPTRMLLAIAIPLILMIATPNPGHPLSLINAGVGSLLFVWFARHRPAIVQVVAGILGGIAVRLLQPHSDLRLVTMVSVVLILGYWMMARAADATEEQPLTSRLTRRTLVAANGLLVLFVAAVKYTDSIRQRTAKAPDANMDWYSARQAATGGIREGSRVALVGSPFEAYWVRAARAKIVAVVPPPSMGDFVQLPADQRRRLYDEFARAGADFVVVQVANPPEGMDRSWMPIQYIGWVKKLR